MMINYYQRSKKLFLKQKADYPLSLIVFALMVFGVIMIYSSSVFIGQSYYNDPTIFFKKQVTSLVLAVVIWLIFQQINYRFWQKWSGLILIIAFILLTLVFFFPARNGAHSWLIFGSYQFQPSEFAKLALILYLASWFEKKDQAIKSLIFGFLPFLVIIGLISLLIGLQPDIGTLSIIILIAVSMYFFANAPLLHLGLGSLIAFFGFWSVIWHSDYRRERLLTFLNPLQNKFDSAYHIQNILISLGSGGWWGLGFGQSRQKRLFLPEPHTDSIFPVIVEELGFIRAIAVILALVFVVLKILRISFKAPDKFSSLVAAGVGIWIAGQSLINIAAMLGLMPLTGIPIPFISYGGSSLLVLAAAIGIVMNISKSIKRE